MSNNTEIRHVEENNGLTTGPTTSPVDSAASCILPNIPLRPFFSSGGLSASFSSSFFRLPPFFFPFVFRLPPVVPPSSFFRSSANRSFENETCPSLAPFSIAPLIQLLLDHSIVQVMTTRVVEPPAHIIQNLVIT